MADGHEPDVAALHEVGDEVHVGVAHQAEHDLGALGDEGVGERGVEPHSVTEKRPSSRPAATRTTRSNRKPSAPSRMMPTKTQSVRP